MDSSYILAFAFTLPFLLLAIGLSGSKRDRMTRLSGYRDVTVGMAEQDMLSIMGGGYSRSVLEGDVVKYEWRINSSASSSGVLFGRALYTHVEQTEAQRVIICVRNGAVTEIDSNIPIHNTRFAGGIAKLILFVLIIVGIYLFRK